MRCWGLFVGVSVALVAACSCSADDDEDQAGATLATSSSSSSATASETVISTRPAVETTESSSAVSTGVSTSDSSTPAAPPTTSVEAGIIDQLAEYQASGRRDGLALFAPLTPAYFYYEGIVMLSEYGDPPPAASTTPVDGGFRIGQGGDAVTLDNFVFDESGLIVDLSRNGIPLSETVVGLGYTAEADGLTGLIHSARLFDGVLQVLMQTTNGSSEDSSFYVDSYVQPDGRQLEAVPTTSLSNTVRPGATVAYIYAVEDATFGGTLYGLLAGGTDNFVYQDIEVVVPAPG